MKATVSYIQEKLAKILNVEQNDITISEMQEDQSRDDAEKDASYDRTFNLLKEKVDKASTSSEKIKLLTIAPDYWSTRAVQEYKTFLIKQNMQCGKPGLFVVKKEFCRLYQKKKVEN